MQLNVEKQLEFRARMRLIDDEARPLAGSYDQYTRLALLGLKPEKGPNDRYFVLFAESQKLFDSIHSKLETPDWIREGFENKWIYIEEVLRRPGPSDDISGYLQMVTDNELWVSIFNYVAKLGILEHYANKVKGKTYGLPQEELPVPGFPEGLRFRPGKKK